MLNSGQMQLVEGLSSGSSLLLLMSGGTSIPKGIQGGRRVIMGVSALCLGQPKLEASQVCSLGSLPPPGSTLPSFPVVLGDLSQTHSPGNGNTGAQ